VAVRYLAHPSIDLRVHSQCEAENTGSDLVILRVEALFTLWSGAGGSTSVTRHLLRRPARFEAVRKRHPTSVSLVQEHACYLLPLDAFQTLSGLDERHISFAILVLARRNVVFRLPRQGFMHAMCAFLAPLWPNPSHGFWRKGLRRSVLLVQAGQH